MDDVLRAERLAIRQSQTTSSPVHRLTERVRAPQKVLVGSRLATRHRPMHASDFEAAVASSRVHYRTRFDKRRRETALTQRACTIPIPLRLAAYDRYSCWCSANAMDSEDLRSPFCSTIPQFAGTRASRCSALSSTAPSAAPIGSGFSRRSSSLVPSAAAVGHPCRPLQRPPG
jgi:hypothetical protein